MSLPLEGIKVLDLSQAIAGPLAGQMLGDLGAEVIKIEKKEGDQTRKMIPPEWDGESMIFLSNNRNKRGISIDLKSEKGTEIVYDMVKDCDVFIENFRTGGAERLGLGYKKLNSINPSLIYLSISGFGRTGPEKYRGGYDIILQAYGGLMGVTGDPEGEPVKVGTSIVDIATGMLGTIGVFSALLTRMKTNEGQYVDSSLLDSQVMLLNYLIPTYYGTGESPTKKGSAHPSLFPYQSFPAKDQYIILGIGNDSLWEKACKALEWEDLLIPKFITNEQRLKNKEELYNIIVDRFKKLNCDEIFEILDEVGVPCTPINSIKQVVELEQVKYRNMVSSVEHPIIKNLKIPSFPINFSEFSTPTKKHPPLLGEHTDEILKEQGFSEDIIKILRKEGIVS